MTTLEAAGPGLVASGTVTAEDLAEVARLLPDPALIDCSVMASSPGAAGRRSREAMDESLADS